MRQGDERLFFPPARIESTLKRLYPDVPLHKVKAEALTSSLLTFEKNSRNGKEVKIGILYQRGGQTTEDEIYANNAGSEEFQEFLDWIGERIELKNWPKYRGGLNTTSTSSSSSIFVFSCLISSFFLVSPPSSSLALGNIVQPTRQVSSPTTPPTTRSR